MIVNCDWAKGLTTDDDIKLIDGNEGLIETLKYSIAEEIQSDEENDSYHLLELYKQADENDRALLDSMLVCICGYGLGSIIRHMT